MFALVAAFLSAVLPNALLSDPANLDAQIVLRTDDTIVGVADVVAVFGVTLDSLGNWYAEVDTDFPNFNLDNVIVRNGTAILREGDASAPPAGAVIASLDDLDGSVTDSGSLGWIRQLEGGGLTNADNLALYSAGVQLFRTGTMINLPGVPVGTTWATFFDAKANEAGQLLLMGSVNDPVQGFVRALTKVQDLGGGSFSEELVAYVGNAQSGAPETVVELETGIHEFALSDAGHAIYSARLTGSPSFDRTIFVDGVVVAREGSPSPVPGRPWQVLQNSQVDVNSSGDYVLTGILTGINDDDALIELSGEVHIREGDVLPAISPFSVTALGPSTLTSPIHLGENGNVLWVGRWSDPAKPLVRGLFLNDRLLVEEGATVIGGALIATFQPGTAAHALSDDGETVILHARLSNNDHVVVVITIGPWVSLGQGLAGTGGLMPCLVGSGTLEVGDTLSLQLTNGRPSAAATLVVGVSELGASFKGGVMVPELDLLLGLPLDGSGEHLFSVPLAAGLPSGTPLFCQFWVQDPNTPAGFSASNAILGTVP